MCEGLKSRKPATRGGESRRTRPRCNVRRCFSAPRVPKLSAGCTGKAAVPQLWVYGRKGAHRFMICTRRGREAEVKGRAEPSQHSAGAQTAAAPLPLLQQLTSARQVHVVWQQELLSPPHPPLPLLTSAGQVHVVGQQELLSPPIFLSPPHFRASGARGRAAGASRQRASALQQAGSNAVQDGRTGAHAGLPPAHRSRRRRSPCRRSPR